VPGETDARLKLFLGTVQRSVRWKARVAEKFAVSRAGRRSDDVRKNLRLPAQTVIENKVRSDLPTVLREQCVVFVLDARGAGRGGCRTVWTCASQEEQQRSPGGSG